MDKLFATQQTVNETWKQGLRNNIYEPSYVSNSNKVTRTKGESGVSEDIIKIEKYDFNETFIGGLYSKLAEKTPEKVPKKAT